MMENDTIGRITYQVLVICANCKMENKLFFGESIPTESEAATMLKGEGWHITRHGWMCWGCSDYENNPEHLTKIVNTEE